MAGAMAREKAEERARQQELQVLRGFIRTVKFVDVDSITDQLGTIGVKELADLVRLRPDEIDGLSGLSVAGKMSLVDAIGRVAAPPPLPRGLELFGAAKAPSQRGSAAAAAVWLPDETVAWICGFLGSKDLARLACTSRGFRQPAVADAERPGAKISVCDEGAALAAMRYSQRVLVRSPDNSQGETWLEKLRALERPARFTASGDNVEIHDDGTVARKDGLFQSCVCGELEMIGGVHFAEFTLLKTATGVRVGVVGAGFEPVGDWLAAGASAEGWMFGAKSGALCHAGTDTHWSGMPGPSVITAGDTVGLLLEVDRRVLVVYLNGRRLGTMARPGVRNTAGEMVAPLTAPLRWAVDVSYGASVKIDGTKQAPPQTWGAVRMAYRMGFLKGARPSSAPVGAAGFLLAAVQRERRRPWRPASALSRKEWGGIEQKEWSAGASGAPKHLPDHLFVGVADVAHLYDAAAHDGV